MICSPIYSEPCKEYIYYEPYEKYTISAEKKALVWG